MKKFFFAAAAGALLALAPGRELAAQPWDAGLPGDDVVSLALRLGAVSPTTTLTDNTKFSGGLAGGVAFTYWATRNLGLRLNYELAKTEGNDLPTAAASQEDPTVSFFGGELNLRYPVGTGSLVLSPYAGGGAGMKQYDWSLDSTGIDRDLVFAWNLTGGLDIRPVSSPWVGVVLEAKRYSSKYQWHAMSWDKAGFNDLLFSVGLTLNH
jgi:opacity protein-like surface antigen